MLTNIDLTKVQARTVWTEDNIVNTPYNDVKIANITLPEYIWRNLNKWPEKTAVVCGIRNRSFTYRQLYEYSRNFAATLRIYFQIKNGDVIGLIMPNMLEYPVAVIGVVQAGAVVTTLNPSFTTNEIYRQLMLAKPKIIISSQEIVNIVQEAIRMTKTDITIITVKNPNENLPPGTISFEELIENNKVVKNVLHDVVLKPNDVVILPYSSGTTGLPKGVELTNRNLVANFAQQEVEGVRHCKETTSQYQDSVMAVLPFYHIYGLSINLLHSLVFGAKIIVLPKFQPTSFLNALKNYKINLLYAAPSLVLFLGTHPEVTKEHLVSVDRLICAAAPIAKSDIRKLFANSRLVNIRGPQVMKGYKDDLKATEAAITSDGWFRTGDLVSINIDGAVIIIDRIKELIKVNGYQVPPAELEGLLKEHPDILDAAVVGIPDVRKGEVPKAFIVLKEGHKATVTNIKDFVHRNVAEYKRIKEIEFLDALPKNPSGKILRRVLKDNNKYN